MPNIPDNAIRLDNEVEIWKIPNFASIEECDRLIQEAESNGFQRSEVDSQTNGKTQSRTSETAFLTIPKSPTGHLLSQLAQSIVGNNHSLEGIQVQRYEKGQTYNPHFDTFEDKDGVEQRSWTVMIYLSNVEEGGGTYFPDIDLRTFPEKGTAVVWNNLKPNGCRQVKTLHMGESVERGVKYIVTYWFHKPEGREYLCDEPNGFISKELLEEEERIKQEQQSQQPQQPQQPQQLKGQKQQKQQKTILSGGIMEFFSQDTPERGMAIGGIIMFLIIMLFGILIVFYSMKYKV